MKYIFAFVVVLTTLAAACVSAGQQAKPTLAFGPDGSFKILLISDLDYVPKPDMNALALTTKLIDIEKPNLVIVNGDCVAGAQCRTPDDLKSAIANVAGVMEKNKIPWAVTFGEHDHDATARVGISKYQMIRMYESYACNINDGYALGIHGFGSKCLEVRDSKAGKPTFLVWLLDSGGTTPRSPADKYDWIHADQIGWYLDTSKEMEAKYGKKTPGVMLFHIPLPEFNKMVNTARVIGQRHEPEDTSAVNGGMYMAVADRGDVNGIFCGHNHMNDYVGTWMGVQLGFDLVAGFSNYPYVSPDDWANDRSRGGRIFLIKESDPANYKTWMRYKDGTTTQDPSAQSWDRTTTAPAGGSEY